MKIEIKTRGSKDYYNECAYVTSIYEKMLKNPKRKVYNLTHILALYGSCILLWLIFFIIYYLLYHFVFYIFLVGILVTLFMYNLIIFIKLKQQINADISSSGLTIIDINDNGVEYKYNETNALIKWENIQNIVINKHSICCLPKKQAPRMIICINTKYKKEFLIGIKKYKKEHLIIDNNIS